jgi:hypothetical protein
MRVGVVDRLRETEAARHLQRHDPVEGGTEQPIAWMSAIPSSRYPFSAAAITPIAFAASACSVLSGAGARSRMKALSERGISFAQSP